MNLCNNAICDSGVVIIGDMINYSGLVNLELGNCGMTPNGMQHLFRCLQSNTHLVSLNVGNISSSNRNRIGLGGTGQLSALLQTNPYLQLLGLRGVGLNMYLLKILNEGLFANQELVDVDFSHNELTDMHDVQLVLGLRNERVQL